LNETLRQGVRAYPGNLTYLDLIRRNKRESVLIMAAVILLGVILGAVIAAALAARAAGGGSLEELLPSAILGAMAALVAGSLAAAWSWFGGAQAILSLSGAVPADAATDPELFHVVEEMAIAGGLPMPKIFVIPDSALNAFATGRDPEHAAVAITHGLRTRLTRDELQGVMAHEMAHVRHYDIRFAMIMATMVGLIVFACDAIRRAVWHGGRGSGRGSSRGKGGGAGVVLMLLLVVLAMIAPLVARLMQLAYSRRREYLADAGAVELTRNPEGLASALTKLAEDADPLVDTANRGTAHMYIVNPLRHMREARQAVDSVFSSHPPIQERIARLMALTR
jgi:heat shock protein HtpX